MDKFEKMKIAIRYWLIGKEYHNALQAMEFALHYHTGVRKDKITPESHHQISIASYIRTLLNIKSQEDTLAVAFLHDLIEDYNISTNQLEDNFGILVTRAVQLLTKDENYSPEAYFNLISKCPIASIVKGADRIHNVQTMNGAFSIEKKAQYIEECISLILPMLKEAKKRFPYQEAAYENIKLVLLSQIELIKISLGET